MATLAEMLERSPFAWLRERDIDLLLCSELHANSALTSLFRDELAAKGSLLSGAWVSHAEVDGESDLVLTFESTDGQIIALIENKITASFQPEQAQRYRLRAERWSEGENVQKVVTALCAPEEYMNRSGAEIFDVRITYEMIAKALRSEGDRRALFLADAIEAGIENYRRGYVMNPDADVSDMWNACWQLAQDLAPKLNFRKPDLKPGRSTWFYFREAEGFSSEERKRVVVVWKAERGQVDLQFSRTSKSALEMQTVSLCDDSMEIVAAAQSASIRISVPKINFLRASDEQVSEIAAGLAACEKLRQFFCQHCEGLLST